MKLGEVLVSCDLSQRECSAANAEKSCMPRQTHKATISVLGVFLNVWWWEKHTLRTSSAYGTSKCGFISTSNIHISTSFYHSLHVTLLKGTKAKNVWLHSFALSEFCFWPLWVYFRKEAHHVLSSFLFWWGNVRLWWQGEGRDPQTIGQTICFVEQVRLKSAKANVLPRKCFLLFNFWPIGCNTDDIEVQQH